jgi:predicted RNase H-like HicB family nuclease
LNFEIEFDQEEDGRWIAEIGELPGVMAYGATKDEAEAAVEALALRVIADRIESEKVGHRIISFAPGVSKWPSSKANRVYRALLHWLVPESAQGFFPHHLAKSRIR